MMPRHAFDDAEGDSLPAALHGIDLVDAHVHLFPDRVFDAIWRWFDTHGWPIRYRLYSDRVLDHLQSRGVSRVVGLHYAHTPGMAVSLNEYVLALAKRRPLVIPAATVLAGEPGAREIVRRAFGEGARAIKLHCHVQRFAPDDDRLDEIAEEAVRAGAPLVMHAGREPSSPAYGVDTYAICAAWRVARLLARHPDLTLVVPHVGADEYATYEAMLDAYPNLWRDTTMVLAGYLPSEPDIGLLARRADRLLYGTDFPNIPYAWDRELKRLAAAGLAPDALKRIASDNAPRVCRTRLKSGSLLARRLRSLWARRFLDRKGSGFIGVEREGPRPRIEGQSLWAGHR